MMFYGKSTMRIVPVLIILCISSTLFSAELTHGPVVGAVTDQSAIFLIRTDSEARVQIELSTDADFNTVMTSTLGRTTNEKDFFTKTAITGLNPLTTYYYRVIINDQITNDDVERSFSTYPKKGEEAVIQFLTGSCQEAGDDPNSNIGGIFPKMAEEDALFFLHQGDWGYPDTTDEESGNPGDYFPLDYARVQATYRAKYNPNFPTVEVLRKMAIDYTYDDHDMVDNNSDWTYPGIENSIRGYREMFPHYPLANEEEGLWHKFSCGNVDVFMVDNRSQRSPNMNAFTTLPPNKIFDDEMTIFRPPLRGHDILAGKPRVASINQMNWLMYQLKKSKADWKFISTGTSFNPGFRGAIELALLLQNDPRYNPIITPSGPITMLEAAADFADKWAGFPGSIFQLVQFIAMNKIENVIILSGDTHTSAIDDGANSILPELMVSSLDRTNSRIVALMEQFGIYIFNKGGHTSTQTDFGNSYGRVTVFGADSVRLDIVSESGRNLASHTVQDGFLPATVGANVVPLGLNFEVVPVGETARQAVIITNTGVEPLIISKIKISDPAHFSVFPRGNRLLMPGKTKHYPVFYTPTEEGSVDQAVMEITTNDPDGPVIVQLIGRGMSTQIGDGNKLTEEIVLEQNYPNPFNPTTTIRFQIPDEHYVTLKIYNITGELITTLASTVHPAGSHSYQWDAGKIASGVYYYRLQAGSEVQVKKLFVLK